MARILVSTLVLAGLAACSGPEAPPTVLSAGAAPSVPAGATAACVSAVEGQTGRTGVTVLASEATGTATTVSLEVPGAAAPWSCVAGADGNVERVTYTGATGGT